MVVDEKLQQDLLAFQPTCLWHVAAHTRLAADTAEGWGCLLGSPTALPGSVQGCAL